MKSKKIIIILCIIIAALITGGTAGAIILLNDDNPDSPPETDKYTVVWKNGDTVLETDIGVPKGTTPIYDGATPVKAADDQYIYEFSGWSPAVSSVTSDITFVAQFNKAPRTFKVEWKNGDTVIETDLDVPYGTNPVYNGEIPTKESTAQYNFSFKGWSPEISAVTGNVTYVAQFTEELRSYTVTFYAEDGATVLATVSVPYGSAAAYPHEDPKKNGTEANTFIFDKWVTSKNGVDADDLQNVTGDRAVYASFKSFTRLVTVYIVSNNTGYGQVSVNKIDSVPYGSAITVTGNTVTVNNQTVTVQTTDATAQYTYEFINWTADATVGSDTTIIANFSRKLNTYTVVWKNGDTVLETDENVNYGTTPTYNGAVPTKPSDNDNVYTFSGWAPVISSVSGNATYEAQFTSTPNVHTVIFYNEDGVTELGRATVSHGATAHFPNQLPIKESTAQYDYEFDKWVTAIGGNTEAVLTNVTTDINVYASYTSTVRKYTVTFCYDDIVDGVGGLIIDEVKVGYNGNATAPVVNDIEGWNFVGWSRSYENVKEDIIVKANYKKLYKVTFLNYDDSVAKEEYVELKGKATPPTESDDTFKIKEGYTYKWDISDYNEVYEDLTVRAIFTIKTYDVEFVLPDGTPLAIIYCNTCKEYLMSENLSNDRCLACDSVVEERFIQTVEHGFSAIAPEKPTVFLKYDSNFPYPYTFTGWNKSYSDIKEKTVITANYDQLCNVPTVVIKYSDQSAGDVNLYICDNKVVAINAIEFLINYKTDKNINITKLEENSASPYCKKDTVTYVKNNNEKYFSFAWSSGKAANAGSSKVMTFGFEVDNAAIINEESFYIESAKAVITVMDINGEEQLKNVTPIVIYTKGGQNG